MMKKNIISSCFTFAISLAMILLASCASDNDEACYFKMETEQTQVNVPAAGISKSKLAKVVIRSNKDWNIQLENPDDAQWVHLFANEGSADGIFRFWVDKNTEFTSRSARLFFTVDGQKQDVPYTIEQAADVPTIAIANAENGYKVLATGGQIKVPVSHNIEWTTLLKDEMNQQTDWIKIDSCGTDSIYLSLEKNTDDTRSAILTCTGVGEYASVMSSTIITQADAGIYLNERFDWMQEGKEDYYYNYPEQGIAVWTEEELSHGWTTLGISNPCLYGGLGYLKLGKTNVAGDALSPKLSNIVGTSDVEVTFKSIGYVSKGGAKDDGVMRVMIEGPGTIEGQDLVDMTVNEKSYRAATFDITVYPNSSKNENGEDYNPWMQPGATFTFRIKGATKDTQLLFVGGVAWNSGLKGKGKGKNRLLLDDIKVKAI